jgi:tetratricopeptide (TPR) repeat protein
VNVQQNDSKPQDPEAELDLMVGRTEDMLTEGNRRAALEQARQVVASFPFDARSYRILSYVLTHRDLYRHESDLCKELVSDGSVAEALACSRAAMRQTNGNHEDYLQAGYCLTALGEFDKAAALIREATDLFGQETQPGLFAGLSDEWVALAPKFLIIGVKKGGTTALHNYLSRHPLVLPPVVKEMDYFAYPERGIGWYLAHFPRRPSWEKRFITGEGHVGKFSRRDIPALVRQQLPDVKLIAVLRDPSKRALSDYYHDKRAGMEQRGLEQAIDEELEYLDCPDDQLSGNLKEYWKTQRGYVMLGLYARHLESWLSIFPAKALLVVISEELKADPETEMRRVYKHLGLKFEPLLDYGNEHPGVYDDQPKDIVLAKLGAFFSRHNERLYELLGRRIDWRRDGLWAYEGPLAVQASQARVLKLKGDFADAGRLWSACLAAFPSHPDRASWLEGAGEALRRSGSVEDAGEAYAGLLASDPHSLAGLSGLAELAQSRRDWGQARHYWEECLSQFPGHAESERWLNACLRAVTELGDWDAAEAVCGRLSLEHPGSAVGPAGLARSAVRKREHARAVGLWEECLSRFPRDPDRTVWMMELARSLMESGNLVRAEQVVSELADMPGSPAEAGVLMAQLAQRTRQSGNLARAETLLAECIKRYPDHPERRWWMPMRGDILLDMQSLAQARDVYSACIASYPDTHGGYGGLARATQRLGDAAASASAVGECIKRFPGNPERRWWLPFYGNALCSLGAWDEAEAVFAEAVRDYPDEPAGNSGLARVAVHRNDWPRAAHLLKDCVNRFPSHGDMSWWQPQLHDCEQRLAGCT